MISRPCGARRAACAGRQAGQRLALFNSNEPIGGMLGIVQGSGGSVRPSGTIQWRLASWRAPSRFRGTAPSSASGTRCRCLTSNTMLSARWSEAVRNTWSRTCLYVWNRHQPSGVSSGGGSGEASSPDVFYYRPRDALQTPTSVHCVAPRYL